MAGQRRGGNTHSSDEVDVNENPDVGGAEEPQWDHGFLIGVAVGEAGAGNHKVFPCYEGDEEGDADCEWCDDFHVIPGVIGACPCESEDK